MAESLTITNALLPDGSTTTIAVRDGMVVALGSAEADAPVLDAAGRLVLPAPAEAHAHLDKAFLAETVPNPKGDLMGAIEAMDEHFDSITREDVRRRAERAARLIASNGATVIRTHADLTQRNGLDAVSALIDVREALRDIVTIQVVALCDFPFAGTAGANARALLREAVAAGVDLVGGCPHLEDDPEAATDAYLAEAALAELPLDLHTDETLDPAKSSLGYLASTVMASGFEHGVTASHCVSLGVLPLAEQQRIAALAAEAGIHVVALPSSNLFLQGRDHPSSTPRGITAVRPLLDAGVNLAAGWDNLQDPFNPMGRGDCLETAAMMVMAAHVLPHEAYTAVSNATRRACGLADAGPFVGGVADLLVIRAANEREAMASASADRVVVRAGAVVSPLR